MTRVALFLLLSALPLALAGCGGSGTHSCASSADCAAGMMCRDGMCSRPGDGGAADLGAVDGSGADAGGTPCGATTCAMGELCGTNMLCCARAALCGSTCCAGGQVCEGAICKLDCGTRTRCENDATGTAACCAATEVCASGSCFMPTTSCRDFVDCPGGQYCDATLGMCLPQPTGTPCTSHPMGGAVVPTELWHWDGAGRAMPTYDQVMMAPAVANLNDDNGDGRVDHDDIPDVLFVCFAGSAYVRDGVLRAVSGDDGHAIFDVTDVTLRTQPATQLAVGDIDGDGLPEVVACGALPGTPGIVAFENDGTFKWRSSEACGGAPSLADLDHDGTVEVISQYGVVHGVDGTTWWSHACTGNCGYTTAADVDEDGELEVVGGNVAYNADGSVLWMRSDLHDGYPAIGDLNHDGHPEVVVVESEWHPTPYMGDHFLRALHGADGTDVWGPIDINQGHAPAADVTSGNVGGGGPPTISNFDDDPAPEIALAGAYGYAVFEADGTLKWWAPTHDSSSRVTGSSVFDFDGDGAAEAVYDDEYWLRVYDGRTGDVRFCQCNTSGTLVEYPLVVDVNNDGHAEIVISENDYAWGTCPTTIDLDPCTSARIAAGATAGGHGIRVFASPTHDWVATRRIWNEHTYHVTNVSEDGVIPTHETPNWTVGALDDFRTNVQPGALNIPNLVPVDLGVELTGCPTRMTLDFRVKNVGWAGSPAGVPVTVYADDGMGGYVRVTRVTTTRALLPGEAESFSVPYDLGTRAPGSNVMFRVIVDDPSDTPLPGLSECDATDNSADVTASCIIFG